MGIDATIPMTEDRERFQKIRITGFDAIDLKDYLD